MSTGDRCCQVTTLTKSISDVRETFSIIQIDTGSTLQICERAAQNTRGPHTACGLRVDNPTQREVIPW
jgi:hypothetical protein